MAGSRLVAGIASGLGAEDAQAGDIILTATGGINIGQVSFVNNIVFTDAIGNGGDISITTGTLSVTGDSRLSASTFGEGNAGHVIQLCGA